MGRVRNGRCQLKSGLVVSFGNGKVVGADGLGGVCLGDPLPQFRLGNETVRHLTPAVPRDLGLRLLHGAPVRHHVIIERAAGNGVFIHGCHFRGGHGAVQNGGDRFLHVPPGVRVHNGDLRGCPPLVCLDALGAVGIHRVKVLTLGLHGIKGRVHRTGVCVAEAVKAVNPIQPVPSGLCLSRAQNALLGGEIPAVGSHLFAGHGGVAMGEHIVQNQLHPLGRRHVLLPLIGDDPLGCVDNDVTGKPGFIHGLTQVG